MRTSIVGSNMAMMNMAAATATTSMAAMNHLEAGGLVQAQVAGDHFVMANSVPQRIPHRRIGWLGVILAGVVAVFGAAGCFSIKADEKGVKMSGMGMKLEASEKGVRGSVLGVKAEVDGKGARGSVPGVKAEVDGKGVRASVPGVRARVESGEIVAKGLLMGECDGEAHPFEIDGLIARVKGMCGQEFTPRITRRKCPGGSRWVLTSCK